MSVNRIDYHVTVLYKQDGRHVAFIKGDGPDNEEPIQAEGDSPLQALAALVEVIREWPKGGSDRWLDTPYGRAFIEGLKIEINGTSHELKN